MTKPDIPPLLLEALKDSQVALSVSYPREPDNPIIAINEGFTRLTGYTEDEVIGRNCRFLQGDTEQTKARNTLKHQMAGGHEVEVILRNFRKSGEAFDNYLFIFPILGGDGDPIFFVGSQFDIPMVNRVDALRQHSDELHNRLGQVDGKATDARGALIRCGHLLGIEARRLINARLHSLP